MEEQGQIKKGFNVGYELEKHAPEICKTIQDGFTDKEHPYAVGFIAGSNEFINENLKEKRIDTVSYTHLTLPTTPYV